MESTQCQKCRHKKLQENRDSIEHLNYLFNCEGTTFDKLTNEAFKLNLEFIEQMRDALEEFADIKEKSACNNYGPTIDGFLNTIVAKEKIIEKQKNNLDRAVELLSESKGFLIFIVQAVRVGDLDMLWVTLGDILKCANSISEFECNLKKDK